MEERQDIAAKRSQCQEVRALLRLLPLLSSWVLPSWVWSCCAAGRSALLKRLCPQPPSLEPTPPTHHSPPYPTDPTPPRPQALRALRAAQATLEGLPAELLGRVNQSGRWSFKQMLAEVPGGGGDGRSPPKADLGNGPGSFNRRLPGGAASQQQQQQLSAAQKAAMSAVSLLSGGIAAHR